MIDAYGSLAIAARRGRISEETLRQAILRGDAAAIPVSDGRRYLVRLSEVLALPPVTPDGPPAFVPLGLVAGIVLTSLGLALCLSLTIVSVCHIILS